MRGLAATIAVALLGVACGAPPGAGATEPSPTESAPEASADAALLARLPEQAFLVVRIGHEAILLSDYGDDLMGDESLLVSAAVAVHFDNPPPGGVPSELARRARETLFVVTLDDVGLDDSFTSIAGDLPAGCGRRLLAAAGLDDPQVRERGETTVLSSEGVGAIAERPGSGLALGPSDRADDVAAFAEGTRRGEPDATALELARRVDLGESALAFVVFSTEPLRAYLGQALVAQGLTPDVVETFRGLAGRVSLRDGITIDVIGFAEGESGPPQLRDLFAQLLASVVASPITEMAGIRGVLERAEITTGDGEATLHIHMSPAEARAMLDRMRAILAALVNAGPPPAAAPPPREGGEPE